MMPKEFEPKPLKFNPDDMQLQEFINWSLSSKSHENMLNNAIDLHRNAELDAIRKARKEGQK